MFYTGKGDDGTSSTFGASERCNKNEPIFQALGTVDELGAVLGICFAKATLVAPEVETQISLTKTIQHLQEDLFILQAELAGADKRVSKAHVVHLEELINEVGNHIENPKAFVIAGSTELSAYLDFARTVARRTERSLRALDREQMPSAEVQAYSNRLSSVLYVLARYAASVANAKEQNPRY